MSLDSSFSVKNLDDGSSFQISENDASLYCDFDTFENGGARFQVEVRGYDAGGVGVYDIGVGERR